MTWAGNRESAAGGGIVPAAGIVNRKKPVD